MPCPAVHFACGSSKAMDRLLSPVRQMIDSSAPSLCLKLAMMLLSVGTASVRHSCLVGGSGTGRIDCVVNCSAPAPDETIRAATAAAKASRIGKSPITHPDSLHCIIRLGQGPAGLNARAA